MKKILVPTDFSACAANAANAALDLADTQGAKLYFYHNMYLPKGWETMTDKQKETHSEVLQNIHNSKVLFQEFEDKASMRGVRLETAWATGNLEKNIAQYVIENEIDFVVMGSHGASGKNDYFIGSNTQKVVRTVHCPVLIVKDDLENYSMKKVVFASSFDLHEQKAFRYFLDFVAPFKPEVHLVAVNTSSWFGQPYSLMKEAMNDFKDMCDLPCKTHFFKDWTVEGGIRNFSKVIGGDLVAISNQERRPLKRLFSGSNVEALVNHAGMPVLTIDFPKGEENEWTDPVGKMIKVLNNQ